ncbi:endocuticle structural glycoprotein ABD-4 [Sergentomyia squamirostris]
MCNGVCVLWREVALVAQAYNGNSLQDAAEHINTATKCISLVRTLCEVLLWISIFDLVLIVCCSVLLMVIWTEAAPQKPQTARAEEPIAILSQDTNIEPDGSYQYSYETANGIKGQETGTLKRATNPDNSDVIIAQGSFSYTAPDGQQISISYSADDENGFVPQGSHLPTSPPIPPAIEKALQYIASQPQPRTRK